ncbi:hypothetical protein [Mycobacterium vicinigordonae]|uniref:Uncharacterized protein n=1 Tax=Mycobacterium vicinigordonae TaxID=1719132 RepID=A0A7D6E066_9MYCO|nr:hypothetical protein [Mycobacterium vicinigordonae]QLL08984.1 hypothetical protein H0P51_08870 [Mycobacterium vicinigordonae]
MSALQERIDTTALLRAEESARKICVDLVHTNSEIRLLEERVDKFEERLQSIKRIKARQQRELTKVQRRIGALVKAAECDL